MAAFNLLRRIPSSYGTEEGKATYFLFAIFEYRLWQG
jgi:hypothetical protein